MLILWSMSTFSKDYAKEKKEEVWVWASQNILQQ